MELNKLIKQGGIFLASMAVVGGLVWWSSADALNALKEAKNSIMIIRVQDLTCTPESTDNNQCVKIHNVNANGKFLDLKNNNQQLTPTQLDELINLMKTSNFNYLTPATKDICSQMQQISFSFEKTTGDPTLYTSCLYSNSSTFPLFVFMEQNMGYPI